MKIKSVEFLGDALDALRSFPTQAVGFQVDRVQRGLEPDDWKPLVTAGKGVKEIRIWDEAGTFRVVYVAKLEDAVYRFALFSEENPAH